MTREAPPILIIRSRGEAFRLRADLRREASRFDALAKKHSELREFFEGCSLHSRWLFRIVSGHIADYERMQIEGWKPKTFQPNVNRPRIEVSEKIAELLRN